MGYDLLEIDKGKVKLKGETKTRNVARLLNELSVKQGDIVEFFSVSINANDVAKDSDQWSYDGNNAPQRLLFVPSLEDMGLDPNAYKVEVRPLLTVQDSTWVTWGATPDA